MLKVPVSRLRRRYQSGQGRQVQASGARRSRDLRVITYRVRFSKGLDVEECKDSVRFKELEGRNIAYGEESAWHRSMEMKNLRFKPLIILQNIQAAMLHSSQVNGMGVCKE